jgi:hypothetical protein
MVRVVTPIQGPFRGLAGHVPAEQVSAIRMEDANNCWIERGAIVKRLGFSNLESASSDDWEIVSLNFHGARRWCTLVSPERYQWVEMLIGKVYEYSGTPKEVTAAKIVLFARQILTPSYAWRLWFGITHNVTKYTYSDMTADGAWDHLNILPYTVSDLDGHKVNGALLLDGGEYTRKLIIPNDAVPSVERAGLPACDSGEATMTTGQSPLNYPLGTFEFAITFCNRAEVESLDPAQPPGIESNYYVLGEVTPDGTSAEVLLRFDYPTDSTVQTITHVRVYRRDVAAGASWWRAVGYFATSATYQEDGDGLTEGTGSGGFDDELHMPGPRKGDSSDYLYDLEAGGQGPWDWAPSRNYVPQRFNYGVLHDNRGFFAGRDRPDIWFTDPINPMNGGHLEHITPDPLRAPMGPITLLASWHDVLVVGTPDTVYIVRGTLVSLTNAGIARGEIVADPGIIFDETDATIGAVRNGTGSYVVANDKLWFITCEGLAYFDGRQVIVVGRPVRDLMMPDEDDFTPDPDRHYTQDEEIPFSRSCLAHDRERHLIVMNVHQYGDWTGVAGAWTCRGSLWCYSYLDADPEPNRDALDGSYRGSWTPFRSIGGAMDDYYSRFITALTIVRRGHESRRSEVVVGIVRWNTTSSKYESAGYWGEVHGMMIDRKNVSGTEYCGVDFLARMGPWDDGLPDRKKKLLSAYMWLGHRPTAPSVTELPPKLNVLVNGNTYVSSIHVAERGYVRTRVGASCQRAQVEFSESGQDVRNNQVVILGYGFDRKLLGQIR